ncbi:hypothetical protein GCM10011571_30660 [Marinithermofilum abyssi]|uniref:Extracellular solute-binding protein n=1 Tax=Marinithermofilum abyssi TaxID=1571185 RepID=A0A8J2VGW0_9BACL|nr:extracellular solute-binding protein [Marinithermofilum abyssi]GGE26323.1 hypothetical protein GCM10011571_30660 [Marinithermofilum abyssi]
MSRWLRWTAACLTVVLAGGATACSFPQAEREKGRFTITSLDMLYADLPPAEGLGVKMIEEKFGVDYRREYVVYSEYQEKLTARVASGDIPDVIGLERLDANFYKWAKQGAFLPLNDYIDQYPTLKRVPREVWNAVNVDGKIVAIPNIFLPNT